MDRSPVTHKGCMPPGNALLARTMVCEVNVRQIITSIVGTTDNVAFRCRGRQPEGRTTFPHHTNFEVTVQGQSRVCERYTTAPTNLRPSGIFETTDFAL